jgi:hypothetical protein
MVYRGNFNTFDMEKLPSVTPGGHNFEMPHDLIADNFFRGKH